MTVLYVADDVSLIDCLQTFYKSVSFWCFRFQMRPFVNYSLLKVKFILIKNVIIEVHVSMICFEMAFRVRYFT